MKNYEIVLALINLEPNMETKMDLLTTIGITTNNDELFKACEEVRNEIAPDNNGSEKIQIERINLLRCNGRIEDNSNSGNEESKETLSEL
jgi:hypothetical protein